MVLGNYSMGVSNVPLEAFDEYGGRIGSAAPFSSSDLQNSKQNPSHEVTILGKKFRLPLNGMPADRYWNKAHTFIGVQWTYPIVYFQIV